MSTKERNQPGDREELGKKRRDSLDDLRDDYRRPLIREKHRLADDDLEKERLFDERELRVGNHEEDRRDHQNRQPDKNQNGTHQNHKQSQEFHIELHQNRQDHYRDMESAEEPQGGSQSKPSSNDHLASMKQIEPLNINEYFGKVQIDPITSITQQDEYVEDDRRRNELQDEHEKEFAMTGTGRHDIPQSTTTFANQQLCPGSNHITLQSHSSSNQHYQSLRNRTQKFADAQPERGVVPQQYEQMVFSNPQYSKQAKKVIPKVPKVQRQVNVE